MVSPPTQRSLIQILARDFASRLATPFFLVDAEGNVIYFNEAAERLLGQRFMEGPAMPASEWSTKFEPTDAEGNPVAVTPVAPRQSGNRAVHVAWADPHTPLGHAKAQAEQAGGHLVVRSAPRKGTVAKKNLAGKK